MCGIFFYFEILPRKTPLDWIFSSFKFILAWMERERGVKLMEIRLPSRYLARFRRSEGKRERTRQRSGKMSKLYQINRRMRMRKEWRSPEEDPRKGRRRSRQDEICVDTFMFLQVSLERPNEFACQKKRGNSPASRIKEWKKVYANWKPGKREIFWNEKLKMAKIKKEGCVMDGRRRQDSVPATGAPLLRLFNSR